MAEKMFAHLKTNRGSIKVRLFPDLAPVTVRSFTELAEGRREWKHPESGERTTARLFDGTIFHRVIEGFMVQGGDPLGTGTGGPGYVFDDEIHPQNNFDRPYLLAMANAGLRGGRGTNGSQFFITVGRGPHLNNGHTIFGEVVEGQHVVDDIAKTETDQRDRPVQDVVLEQVVIERG